MRALPLAVLCFCLVSCSTNTHEQTTPPPQQPPPGEPPSPSDPPVPDTPPVTTGQDDVRCAEPRPGPDWKCMQDCGPPVAREGDPPPSWRWLSPEDAANRERSGCPRCLPANAAIATPAGDVAVSSLVAGQLVWSLDERGQRIAAPVVRVGSTPAPSDHHLVVLDLADGRTVTASAPHPLADGRALGAIAVGDLVDGARVAARHHRPYGGERTFDLLPASATGAYWADGVLVGSTLR